MFSCRQQIPPTQFHVRVSRVEMAPIHSEKRRRPRDYDEEGDAAGPSVSMQRKASVRLMDKLLEAGTDLDYSTRDSAFLMETMAILSTKTK